MDRRELFGALGAGLTLGGAAAADAPPLNAPVAGPFAHFCGIHAVKKNPKLQFIAQHYCTSHAGGKHAGDMFQCVLFDSCGPTAKLIGVEYLIGDERYQELPADEKKYWHPHTYEVLGGGLIAPSMSAADEQKFMKLVLTTWGKAWHTWPDPASDVPTGEPLLIWSITGDGQTDEKVLAERDRQFKVSTEAVRERRVKQFGLEVPQVPPPKSVDEVGRQWTASGADKPTRRK